ncbi:MAG: TetR/AcrR family transcriptional regulator [Desulfobacterales bacterium]|nr:TetR/AcrR family transcriptional regulator [Desulfobacterales bacterium]
MNKAERTRSYIIEKSAPIFNKKGISGTSLSDLTRATGLTKGGIYGNFNSKDELAIAVFKYNVDNLTRFFIRGINNAETFINKLLAYPTAYRKLYKTMLAFGGCPILNTATEADDTHQMLCRLTAEAIEGWRKKIIELIENGRQAGEIRQDTDADRVAGIMIALFEGGGILSKVTGRDNYMMDAIDHVEYVIHSTANAVEKTHPIRKESE